MKQRTVDNEKRTPSERETLCVRPLPVISDFVVEHLPSRLAAIRDVRESFSPLLRDVRRMLKTISFDRLTQDQNFWPLALLDLKMLEGGLAHTARLCGEEIVIPGELVSLIDLLSSATGRTTLLTYEEIVLGNPQHDTRTFTLPYQATDALQPPWRKRENDWLWLLPRIAVSRKEIHPTTNSEEQFYVTHRIIEAHMSQVLLHIRTALVSLATEQRSQIEDASRFLQQACNEMTWIQNYATSSFHQMRNEDFLLFREYLRGHPSRHGPGASGAASPSFAELDIRLSGIFLPEQDIQEIHTLMASCSASSRAVLADALEMSSRGYSLMSLSSLLGHPKALDDAIGRLSQSLRLWRSAHYRIVADHLPDVIKGRDVGTGGNAGTHHYLTHKMHLHDSPIQVKS